MVGSSVGRLHWPGSRRTLEGSASVFVSTLASLVLVSSVAPRIAAESEDAGGWWLWGGGVGWGDLAANLAWPAAIVSLMEAFTTQVDQYAHIAREFFFFVFRPEVGSAVLAPLVVLRHLFVETLLECRALI